MEIKMKFSCRAKDRDIELPSETGKIKEDAVLCLSDMHIGKINRFLNLNTGEKEITYNKEIMLLGKTHNGVHVTDITVKMDRHNGFSPLIN